MSNIVTGFEPFGGDEINPSQELVKLLQQSSQDLVCEVLATEYDFAGDRIRQLIKEHAPNVIVMLGLSGEASSIKLERVALNIDDASLADNAGDLRKGQAIRHGAPLALKTSIDLPELQAELRAKGYDVVISNHAGTYICNHIYYCALDHLSAIGSNIPCLFVHVPKLKDSVEGQDFAAMRSAVEDLIEILGRN